MLFCPEWYVIKDKSHQPHFDMFWSEITTPEATQVLASTLPDILSETTLDRSPMAILIQQYLLFPV